MVLFVNDGNCGNCEAVKDRLKRNGLEFTTSTDVDFLIEKGYQSAPVLQVNGALYDLKATMSLLKEFEAGKGLLKELTDGNINNEH